MVTTTAAVKTRDAGKQAELEEELRQAEQDFARSDFIEITIEELDRCVAAGKWPWPEESSEEARRFAAAWRDSASPRGPRPTAP